MTKTLIKLPTHRHTMTSMLMLWVAWSSQRANLYQI